MTQQEAQLKFITDYNKVGIALQRPLVDALLENKHGIVNPVTDLSIRDTTINFTNSTIIGKLPIANETPAGSNTQLQFNDSGDFGADAGLFYDKTTNILSVDTISNTAAGTFFTIQGLDGNVSSQGTSLQFYAGNGYNAGSGTAGGGLLYAAGNALAGNNDGGDVEFSVGQASGAGNNGRFIFDPIGGTTVQAILNFDSLTTSNKTFTFPNASGTIILNTTGSALTKTDDTNVTLTLGGSPTTALVNAASLTLGWTGQLSIARGGTGATTLLGAGIPTKTSTVSLTAQSADIGSTNLTTTGNGLYRLAYYLVDSTADLTAGAVRLNITYTDNGASQTQQSATVALTILGTFTQGELIIQLASGNIAYSTTHTGIFGTAKYDLFITLERLN